MVESRKTTFSRFLCSLNEIYKEEKKLFKKKGFVTGFEWILVMMTPIVSIFVALYPIMKLFSSVGPSFYQMERVWTSKIAKTKEIVFVGQGDPDVGGVLLLQVLYANEY